VDIIQDMFPDAQFIYLARDPRAGTASMQRADFFPGDFVFNALSRRKHFRMARHLLRRHVPSSQWTEIRYEDLVRAPRETLHRVCNFLAEPFEEGMLAYHRDAKTYMKAEAATSFNKAATHPVSVARIDAWREQISGEAIAVIEAVCAEEMKAFGYQPDGHCPSWSSQINRFVKTTYWHWQMWRNRDNRHYTVKAPIFARSRHRLGLLFPVTASPNAEQTAE
jgi:hypothetical protein